MKIYSKNNNYTLYQGNCLDMLDVLEENSIDSIVTDPPYELNFMGKGWDNAGISFQPDTWKKCYEVLKPGGYLLAFGGSRTFHRIACAIEDAGFEIRDTIMWLYGSGMPKSMNIGLAIDKKNGVESIDTGIQSPNARPNSSKSNSLYESGKVGKSFTIKIACNEWKGWGTSLKPAYEPIIVARKPVENTIVGNVLKYGVGGINIDECRVGTDIIKGGTMPDFRDIGKKSKEAIGVDKLSFGQVENAKRKPMGDHIGRFPANVILTYDDTDFDEVCGRFPNTKGSKIKEKGNYGYCFNEEKRDSKPMADGYNDEGSAARYFKNCPYTEEDCEEYRRYFYSAKASKKDRDEGLDEFEEQQMYDGKNAQFGYGNTKDDNFGDRVANVKRKNTHPTVKPTELMRYLVRMVTPNGGTVLDPFNGSGSTGKATMLENTENNKDYKYIGIELTEEYLPIAKARIEYAQNKNLDIQTKK